MLDTEVPKKTMRLCKFHSCTLSTCIGLWLELWSANTCMNRHRISKCLSMETGRLTNSTYILDIALVYLVDLKVSAIQWETTPHSCSTRNLFMFHQLIISWNVHKINSHYSSCSDLFILSSKKKIQPDSSKVYVTLILGSEYHKIINYWIQVYTSILSQTVRT